MLLGVLLSVAGRPTAATASPYPSPTVELQGHGWGHGRGMGQYGALGYAIVQGWKYSQILDHFYGGTQAGTTPNSMIGVHLLGQDGMPTAVVEQQAHLTTSADNGTGRYSALRAVIVGPNQFRVDQSSGCAGPWSTIVTSTAGPVNFAPLTSTASASTDTGELLQLCQPGGTRWLRGTIQAVDPVNQTGQPGDQRTVNTLALEDYLLGVVPSESPASWGDLGGGTGIEALKAQAVAARSYVAARSGNGYSKICDTDLCQVYRGRAVQDANGYRDVEDPRATRAVVETSGEVRTLGGQVVSTEFSSSTGGYTAGGRFPPVPDDGDSVPLNPYHNWDVTPTVSSIESAYPGIGSLVWLQVTQRNGLGDLGGRVTQIQLQGTAGTVTTTGDEFAASLFLRTAWFRIMYPGGYWMVGSDGGVFSFGNAQFYGSTGNLRLVKPIVGMDATSSKHGYWLAASDGGIFSFGDAQFFGSTGGMRLNKPVVGMAGHAVGAGVTATASGYWLVATDGGIFSFGDAQFFGSTGSIRLNQPIVGMAPTPTGNGYWLVASDGGIFSFGDAQFFGSTGSIRLNKPIVGMAPTPTGSGYWLVASDGGIFSFGDAQFLGSTGSIRLNQPVTGLRPTPTGAGYYLLGADGGLFNFGDAAFFGSVPGVVRGSTPPKVAIAITQTR